jgi:hypothetical protein
MRLRAGCTAGVRPYGWAPQRWQQQEEEEGEGAHVVSRYQPRKGGR